MPYRQGEIEGVEVRPLQRFEDERGWLAELFRVDEMAQDEIPVMGYVSVTAPGVERGPHEHHEQTDRFCFAGPGLFEIHMWDNRPESPTYQCSQVIVAGDRAATLVVIPPGVVHGYRNIGADDAMVINLPNKLYKGEGRAEPVDEIRHENIPSSPFRMS